MADASPHEMIMNNYRNIIAAVMAASAMTAAYPQTPAGFDKFRQGLMDNFDSFRSRILEHYADFLAGEWHEYESLEAENKFSEPKPGAMPVAELLEAGEGEEQRKEMLSSMGFLLGKRPMSEIHDIPDYMKWMRGVRNLYKSAPDTVATGDIVTPEGFAGTTDGEEFNFYGMRFSMPRTEFTIAPSVVSTADYALQWESLVAQDMAGKVIPGIEGLQKVCGLSDYLMFEMLFSYLDQKFPEANDASKMSATHFVMTNMGFGVRLAMDDNANPFILLPFDEKIYGRSGLKLGKQYYVFSTPGRPMVKRMGISSPYLPDNAEHGKTLSLRMDGLRLPHKPYRYAFEHEGLKIEGELNENVMPMLYRYPQMETGGFGASMISPDVREDVVRQVKEQLGSDDPLKGADRLLALIQYAFPYEVDDEFHGFEKPYFFEECLYYPKSDCEDRAVFYSYLLWNALGLESQLIAYPGHEAASLKAESVWGGDAHYLDGGHKYFISDPTYLGAPTGQCMSRFRDVEPTVDLSYPE